MGRTHALSGAAAWLTLAPTLTDTTGLPVGAAELLAGAAVAAGAAMLPDLDHPSAGIAGTLGPATRLLTRAVATVAGGHRQATHSLAYVALAATGAAAAVAAGPAPVLVAAGACVAFGLRALGPDELRDDPILDLELAAAAAALTALAAATVTTWSWLPAAVALGCLLHLAGDALTPHGVPLWWPLHRRIGVAVFLTGGCAEQAVQALLNARGAPAHRPAAQPMTRPGRARAPPPPPARAAHARRRARSPPLCPPSTAPPHPAPPPAPGPRRCATRRSVGPSCRCTPRALPAAAPAPGARGAGRRASTPGSPAACTPPPSTPARSPAGGPAGPPPTSP